MEPLPMKASENRSRYANDLTDMESVLIAPLIPPAKRGGNKSRVEMRSVIDGLMSVRKERRLRLSPNYLDMLPSTDIQAPALMRVGDE